MTAKTYYHNAEERESIDGCPACGHDQCTREDYDYNGKEYYEFYTCDACGQEFTEVYTYKHTEYTKEA